jgi:hypothetical protein
VLKELGVNVMGQAGDEGDGQICQQAVDTKAFTGKGGLALVRELSKSVDRLHEEMRKAVETSTNYPALVMYLCIHTRSSTGQQTLRWRAKGGKSKHLSWDEVEEVISKMGYADRLWYQNMTNRALLLNETEKHLRPRLRKARAAVGLDANGLPIGQGDLFNAK